VVRGGDAGGPPRSEAAPRSLFRVGGGVLGGGVRVFREPAVLLYRRTVGWREPDAGTPGLTIGLRQKGWGGVHLAGALFPGDEGRGVSGEAR